MRTGVARPARRPLHLVRACTAIVMAIAVAAASTACGDNSPVSVPTTTLPAQQPSPTEAAPTVPEYTTDLDLNDEEKKAVDGALLAFEGFFESVNTAYKGNFEAVDDFPRYARADALKSIQGDAKVIEDGSYVFSGNIEPTKVTVAQLGNDTNSDADGTGSVVVQFCFDLSKWSLTPKDETPTRTSDFATMEHQITNEQDGWKVAAQSLKERSC